MEEERIKLEEERELQRLENIRLEAERKEKKKQREIDRKARLKAEGKLLTAKQKHDQIRAQAMLESLRAQGVELPEVGEKRPRPGTRIRNKKKDQQTGQEGETAADGTAQTKTTAKESEIKADETPEPPKEVIKDSWDASSSEDESKEESAPVSKVADKAKAVKQESAEKSESEEDSGSNEDESSGEDESDVSNDDDNKGKTDAEVKREKAWQRILVSCAYQKCANIVIVIY